jgi:Ca-activated chloride channel family protein
MTLDFDPFDLLEVGRHAGDDEIKAAYRRLARRLHPDVNNSGAAARQFQYVSAAYDALMDLDRRNQLRHATSDEQRFTLRTIPSKRHLTILDEPQVMYLLAEIFPDPRAAESSSRLETPLNLTLVLDHSNSMNGARLEKVKIAAHQIIDNLKPTDVIAVVSFNDRATVVIPATPARDKPALKARITMMTASGGTEIYHGLNAGVEQVRKHFSVDFVNHVLMLTDGRTYGDQAQCLELASDAAREGISISAMGLGSDWNDEFLDQLAGKTGGRSEYISSAGAVVKFLDDHVRQLSNSFAERVKLSLAPDADIRIESAFRLSPSPQPVEVVDDEILLGVLHATRPLSVLIQFQVPKEIEPGSRSLIRVQASGDILGSQRSLTRHYLVANDLSLSVSREDADDEPPAAILNALSKLTLYRLQERANHALDQGNYAEATRRLENLATRLLEMGHEALANETLSEVQRVKVTRGLSDEGKKKIKYQTRFLLASENNSRQDD